MVSNTRPAGWGSGGGPGVSVTPPQPENRARGLAVAISNAGKSCIREAKGQDPRLPSKPPRLFRHVHASLRVRTQRHAKPGCADRFTCAASTARCEMRRTETVKTRVFFFTSAVSQLSDIRADGWEITWVDVGGARDSDVGVGDHPLALTTSSNNNTRLALQKKIICPLQLLFSCRHGNGSPLSASVCSLQAPIQMSPSTSSHLWLLVVPVMSLLLLFSPIGWSHDSRSLTPGCHLHRKCTPQTAVTRGGWPRCQVKQSEKDHDLYAFPPLEGGLRLF